MVNRVLILLVIAFVGCPRMVNGDIPTVGVEISESNYDRLRYKELTCGIYSMLAASKALSLDLKIEDVFSQKYISDVNLGSSPTDLEKMARLAGAHTQLVSGADIGLLSSLDSPTILFLKGRSDRKCGGHWVTFLGYEGQYAAIYDSTFKNPIRLMQPSEILVYWDGTAVLVQKNEFMMLDRIALFFSSFKYRLLFLLGPLGVILATTTLLKTKRTILGLRMQLTSLAFITVFICLTSFFFDSCGILKNKLASNWMTDSSVSDIEFGEATFSEVHQLSLSEKPDAVLVDARTHAQFSQNTIPNSQNLSINSDIIEFRNKVANLELDDRYIVFCNDENCLWAETVAARMHKAGFREVEVYRQGVAGYVKHASQKNSPNLKSQSKNEPANQPN